MGRGCSRQRNSTSKGMVCTGQGLSTERGGGVQRRSEGSAEMTGWPHIMDLLGNLNEPDSTLSIRNPTESPGDL